MKYKINKVAQDTNQFLNKYLKNQKKTNLLAPMRYSLLPGGKKIRSKILTDVGKIFNLNYNLLIHIGAAVECIHAYSLIHDDLPCMDNDDMRRGKLSTHKKLKLSNAKKNKLINLISKSSGHSGIAGGQFSDLNFEKKKISKNKIIDMQIKKTGKLFSFCCSAPAIIGGRGSDLKKFELVGENIGLLFQISDDLIDYKGKSSIAGK